MAVLSGGWLHAPPHKLHSIEGKAFSAPFSSVRIWFFPDHTKALPITAPLNLCRTQYLHHEGAVCFNVLMLP